MTKMTYAMAINNAINAIANMDGMGETVEKLQALQVSLANRNKKGGERKPTKTQKENEELKERILDALTTPMTASEVGALFEISNQKASALLTAMTKGDAPTVERFTEKRKAYFKAVA